MSSDNAELDMPLDSRRSPDMPALLRGVSRSFYLSICLLPPALRQPIAVAYLLARATDTLADTAQFPGPQRLDTLQALAGVIDGKLNEQAILDDIATSFAPVHDDERERALMLALPQCLALLARLDSADRDDVRTVLRHITRGQCLDVERFAQGPSLSALSTSGQLDQYTYLVAGSVGEFWTDLCARHLPDFASRPTAQMRELGRDYGMGLQLVNVLRDTAADLAQGRCYLPADELAACGLSPADMAQNPQRGQPVRERWLARAMQGLAQGMRYADAVNSRRVRAASALPALLGARTLALMRADMAQGRTRPVKVPRREVRAVLARMALTLAGRAPMNAMFAQAAGGDLPHGWDNRRP